MDRLAESFQQQLTVEGILTLVVNTAIILAIIHYLIVPLVREVREDFIPAKNPDTTSFAASGQQAADGD